MADEVALRSLGEVGAGVVGLLVLFLFFSFP